LIEVLKHLPELLGIRKSLVQHWQQNPPDLFIGVDAPDFNLGLELRLKNSGIPTVQYVSPTVWAWRQGRVKKIRRATNLVLSIFPFEVPFLARFNVKAVYAGHPLVQKMAALPDRTEARQQLNLDSDARVLAILPGSRLSEIDSLMDDFLQTAVLLQARFTDLKIVIPAATAKINQIIQIHLGRYPDLTVNLLDKQSDVALAAADAVLVASGTASLETLLHRKPMVVAYKLHWLSYFLLFKLKVVKTRFISMPNIIAGREIVPELYQENCKPDLLAARLADYFDHPEQLESLNQDYEQVINELSGGDIQQAAAAVLELVEQHQR